MEQFSGFIGSHNLVVHNASFDRRFLDSELSRINRQYTGAFACSMLVTRRVYQNAPNHTLGGLVELMNIPTDGVFHRHFAQLVNY